MQGLYFDDNCFAKVSAHVCDNLHELFQDLLVCHAYDLLFGGSAVLNRVAL